MAVPTAGTAPGCDITLTGYAGQVTIQTKPPVVTQVVLVPPTGQIVITLTVLSSGVEDQAGNSLNGAFNGRLPTGYGPPNSDFQAQLNFNGFRVFPPIPVGHPSGVAVNPATPRIGSHFPRWWSGHGGRAVHVVRPVSHRFVHRR